MAYLWKPDGEGWSPEPLAGDAVRCLDLRPDSRAEDGGEAWRWGMPRLIHRVGPEGVEQWILLAHPLHELRVNGVPLPLGVRMLQHKDRITLGSGLPVYFSEETQPRVLPYPGADRVFHCPRCKLPMEPGQLAVRCPSPKCRLWHHQLPERPCWTYAEGCAVCRHPTALDGSLCWTPEVVES